MAKIAYAHSRGVVTEVSTSTTVERDRWGFILTGPDTSHWPLPRPPFPLETTLPGVFAVGDVRHGSIKRVASAVGEGLIAIRLVHDYLAPHPWLAVSDVPDRCQEGSASPGKPRQA
jgi:thioredoxin reductase